MHDLTAGLGNVGREREQQILGDPLLNGDSGRGVGIVAAESGIDLETGNASQLLDAAAQLSCDLGSDHRIGALTASRLFLRGLATGYQVDDVRGGQWGIRGVFRGEFVERAAHGERQVVLLDGGVHGDVEHGMGLVGIVESDHAALQFVTHVAEEEFA